jgi:hypothetical protein
MVGGEHLLVTASLLVRLATGTVVRCAVAHYRFLASITWIKAANEWGRETVLADAVIL